MKAHLRTHACMLAHIVHDLLHARSDDAIVGMPELLGW